MAEQKRVSFPVAKAIKEAGYPQKHVDGCSYFDAYGIGGKPRGESHYLVPTYLDVWLWLWREKGIYIEILHYYSILEVCVWDEDYNLIKRIERQNANADPEEAIIAAIEDLVNNDLIV